MDATQPAHVPADVFARRWQIHAVLSLALVMVVVAVSSLNVAIPTLVRQLEPTATELLWIIDAYALVFAGLLLFAGALGDRFGRRRALLAGLVVFGSATLAASFADEPTQLIAARAVMGVGAALIMPATLSIITWVFPPQERARAIALWAGLAGAGGAIGPLVAGTLLEFFWWGSVFFINLPIVVVLIGATLLLIPESKDPEGRRLDVPGALLSVVGLSALVYAIIEGPELGWTSTQVMTGFVVGIVALAGFVWWELRTRYPMLDPRLFAIRGFSQGSLSITLLFFSMFGLFFVLTQYLQFARGTSALGAGVRMLPAPLMMITVAPRSPRLVSRFGARHVMAAGFGLQAIGLAGMGLLQVDTPYPVFAVILAVTAAGMAMAMPPATSAIIGSLPLAKAGVGSAVNDTTREVGGAIGIAVLGSALTAAYRSAVEPDLDQLPEPARELAGDSVGGALSVAATLGEQGPAVATAAIDAFVDALRWPFWIGAAVGVTGAVVTLLRFPAVESAGEEVPAPQAEPVTEPGGS